jgi:hypothetical protein
MNKVVVMTNLTLDEVMQAPGRPDEDTRGGFEHGGWATPCPLLGRRTYLIHPLVLGSGRRLFTDGSPTAGRPPTVW